MTQRARQTPAKTNIKAHKGLKRLKCPKVTKTQREMQQCYSLIYPSACGTSPKTGEELNFLVALSALLGTYNNNILGEAYASPGME